MNDKARSMPTIGCESVISYNLGMADSLPRMCCRFQLRLRT
jgi:hypothetical protein